MRDITVKCMAMLHVLVERYRTWQYTNGRMLQTVLVWSNSINWYFIKSTLIECVMFLVARLLMR